MFINSKKGCLKHCLPGFSNFSCSPNKAQEQQGEVEIFRSEVMPSMGSLMNLQKQLKEKIIKTTSKEQVDELLHDIEVLLEENKKE